MDNIIRNREYGKRFDYYEWSAPFFDTPQEVVRYIASTDKTRSELTDAEIDELGKRVLRLLLISMKDSADNLKI